MTQKTMASVTKAAHQLCCIGCGATLGGLEAAEDFRCRSCGNLFEVKYPDFTGQPRASQNWVEMWRQRRASHSQLDRSGVWRFRELLPIVLDERHVVTLEEGNTRCTACRDAVTRWVSIICMPSTRG